MEVTLRLHGALQRHARIDGRQITVEVADTATLTDLFDTLADQRPALERAVRDETGTLRPHINVFLDGDHIRERRPNQHLRPDSTVLLLPAVSGGA